MSKKVDIPLSDLTPVYVNGEYKYTLRYRIISDNRNRFSEWSPYYDIAVPSVTDILGDDINQITVTSTTSDLPDIGGTLITSYVQADLDWLNSISEFDVFVRKQSSATGTWTNWEYHSTQPNGPISVISTGAYSQVQISLFVPSYPKEPHIITNVGRYMGLWPTYNPEISPMNDLLYVTGKYQGTPEIMANPELWSGAYGSLVPEIGDVYGFEDVANFFFVWIQSSGGSTGFVSVSPIPTAEELAALDNYDLLDAHLQIATTTLSI